MKWSPAILLPLALGLFTGIALLIRGTDPVPASTTAAVDHASPPSRPGGKQPAAILPAKAPPCQDKGRGGRRL